jgi:hypothetical protein
VQAPKLPASARMTRSFIISVRSEIISDHLSILHDKPDALAAGESTFPVHGSSNRPAFTNVVGEGDWAASCVAANIVTANEKIRFKLMCSFRMRCTRIIIVPAPERI